MFSNINDLHGNGDELAISATKFDVIVCYETKVTGRRHEWKLLLPDFKAPTLLLRGACPKRFGMALFVRSGHTLLRQEKILFLLLVHGCYNFWPAAELLFVCCLS